MGREESLGPRLLRRRSTGRLVAARTSGRPRAANARICSKFQTRIAHEEPSLRGDRCGEGLALEITNGASCQMEIVRALGPPRSWPCVPDDLPSTRAACRRPRGAGGDRGQQGGRERRPARRGHRAGCRHRRGVPAGGQRATRGVRLPHGRRHREGVGVRGCVVRQVVRRVGGPDRVGGRIVAGTDVVVYSSMEGTGPLVAAKLGVPAVSHGFGLPPTRRR